VVLAPAIKRVSLSSCPYELAEFGGLAQYVSHWRWGVADGGPGHCFPSGHAVSAFGFFGLYFMWRWQAPRRARAMLVAVLLTGLLFGAAQLARGAHYPSHTLWTAWLCWLLCAVAAHTVARPAPAL
jgi:membrane-associated PAP2 superfamily phosphatase